MTQEYSSGTVSKILWHFTGGPNWDIKNNKQHEEIKNLDEAFEILKAIIKSKQLRLSNYNEVVNVRVPKYKYVAAKKLRVFKGYTNRQIEASPICCLADIPIQHLNYHAERYGKFAIGFHRSSAVINNFNPVLYTLNSTNIVNSIYSGLSSIEELNFDNAKWIFEDFLSDIKRGNLLNTKIESSLEIETEAEIKSIEFDNELDELKDIKKAIEKSLKDFIAYTKTFSNEEFGSIYCEREWRSIQPYHFEEREIAMIVLPRETGHYQKFLSENLLPGIPIVPWEDLIES
jgi:hypothetical protein